MCGGGRVGGGRHRQDRNDPQLVRIDLVRPRVCLSGISVMKVRPFLSSRGEGVGVAGVDFRQLGGGEGYKKGGKDKSGRWGGGGGF